MITWVAYLLIFFLGAAVGSFLNVMISRSIKGEDWVRGRSRCDYCQKTLSWFDMIPLLSYIAYRGKSRCCHKKLSIQHPIVELLTGLLFVWWVTMGTVFFRLVMHPLSTLQPIYWLLMGIILIGIFVMDMFYGLIPTTFVYMGVVMTIVYRIILGFSHVYQWTDLVMSLLAAFMTWLFFYFLRYITKGRGMGEGDVILAIFMGLVLSFPKIYAGLLISFVTGAIVSTLLLAIKVKKMRSTIPFGPFMVIGMILALVIGDRIIALILG